MTPNRALFVFLIAALSFAALGCVEDVGDCDDPNKGQDTVLVGKSGIQYGGQAIMNNACAIGCHNSNAKGNDRHGAPAGLNFDVAPVIEGALDVDGVTPLTDGTLTDAMGRTVVNLTPAAVKGLRARQRMIFEKRNDIWAQVKEGLMPPDGMFKAFKALLQITDTPDTTPCTAVKNKYLPITTKASQDVLRKWLACNVPIVESYGTDVGEDGVAGQAGYQYISCVNTPSSGDSGITPGKDGGPGDGGGTPVATTITLEDVQADVFSNTFCSACHPSMNPSGVKIDFTKADTDISQLYAALVTDKAVQCNGKPYVTPGDPSKSWLYDVLSLKNPGCDTTQMPQGLPGVLTAVQLKEVSDWITQGAKRASDVKSLSPLNGGLDAGAP